MRTTIGTLFFIAFFACITKAQNIIVNEDPVITKMMALFIGKAASAPTTGGNAAANPGGTNTPIVPQVIDGFRIQILASTDRRQVEAGQSTFAGRYPGTFVTWQQAKPYYRLRVGAFNSRSDASRYLQNIKRDYPDAYIVPDKVKTNEITN